MEEREERPPGRIRPDRSSRKPGLDPCTAECVLDERLITPRTAQENGARVEGQSRGQDLARNFDAFKRFPGCGEKCHASRICRHCHLLREELTLDGLQCAVMARGGWDVRRRLFETRRFARKLLYEHPFEIVVGPQIEEKRRQTQQGMLA
jgi:hypothetical protein